MPNPAAISPLVYQPAYEYLEEDEAESIASLKALFIEMAKTVAQTEGHAHRAVHAKGQGLLRGTLKIVEGLPQVYSQGIFAAPGEYDVLARLSSPPAEQLPDTVSTPRAMAIKIMGVPGEHVPESTEDDSQDFLMVNGPAFVRPGPKGFLKDSKLLAMTTEKSPMAKTIVSTVLRGAEAVIEAVGGESAKIKNMGGHPKSHPLGETYFTQAPFLFGPYMGKFSLAPVSPALTALAGESLETEGEDAQRKAVIDFFATQADTPAQWELRVQLCTDIEKMPLEDASVVWDEELSPYVTVATLTVPAQQAWNTPDSENLEDRIAFDPWHAVTAHRPLGALNRTRLQVMAASRQFRSEFNRCPIHSPGFGRQSQG